MLAAAGGAESSVGSVYCVVYRLVALEWQVTGAGWSQVQVFRDSGDGSHRLVGWTVEDGLLTINSNISADCHYKRKSDDFHKLTDEEGQQWGQPLYGADSSPCSDSADVDAPSGCALTACRCLLSVSAWHRLRLLQEG